MNDYIKREDAIFAIEQDANCEWCDNNEGEDCQTCPTGNAISAIADLPYSFEVRGKYAQIVPSADVEERKRGKWTDLDYFYDDARIGYSARCSACGDKVLYGVWAENGNRHQMNFCPNCGADMRE